MPEGFMDHLSIKKLQPEHLDQYNDLLRYAFQVTEEMLLKVGWEDEDIRQSKFPILQHANVLGWFDEDRLASQLAVYPMKMNLYGAVVDMGFITGVATYPEYVGKGLMSSLMKKCLTEMRENQQSIALLYPYSIPLYRKKGFEIISDKMTYSLQDFQLPKLCPVNGYVRRVAEDSGDLTALHNKFAAKTHGCIYRNSLAWEEYWRWDVDDITVAIYYSENDEPLGYIVYLLKNEILYIKEMVHLNMEAWKGLWNYITNHESMIVEVKGNNYSNNPIAFWLDDSDIKETIRPYIMARIVDVGQFLTQYQFLEADRERIITFHIIDELLEWNNHPFTLWFRPGEKPVLTDRATPHTVTLSIGTLTTMLMGYKAPAYLQSLEKLATDKETLAFLERVISKEKAYISDYI